MKIPESEKDKIKIAKREYYSAMKSKHPEYTKKTDRKFKKK